MPPPDALTSLPAYPAFEFETRVQELPPLTGDAKAQQLAPGLLHHSDRGVQYCSDHYVARLRAHGCGQFAPVASNDSDAGRAKNRRVELVKQ